MLVVSDASPANVLIRIGQIDVLPALFHSVVVPTAVAQELTHRVLFYELPLAAGVHAPGAAGADRRHSAEIQRPRQTRAKRRRALIVSQLPASGLNAFFAREVLFGCSTANCAS